MKTKSIAQANKHLRDKKSRQRAVRRSVLTSSAVEGIDSKRMQKALHTQN